LKKLTRWLKSRAGLAVMAGSLLVILLLTAAGFGLGWWRLASRYLRGTAGGEGDTVLEIELFSFTAVGEQGQVVLSWETGGERNSQGFYLYRAENGTESFVPVNSEPIPSQPPGTAAGATYTFADTAVTAGMTYTYQLKAVGLQAEQVLLGSIMVEAPQVTVGLPPIPPVKPPAVVTAEVKLLSFTALAQNNQVVLNWETQDEQNLQGFDLYRAEGEAGAFVRLNDDLLPCHAPESVPRADYQFIDPAVTVGVTYTYRLECMAAQGTSVYSSSTMVEVPQVETGLPPVPPRMRYHVFLPLVLKNSAGP
jgi:hypothetical protein